MAEPSGQMICRQFAAYHPPHNPTFGNSPFEGADYRVLIARLSPFRDVDRSIPHLWLFQEVRRALPRAYVDLAFFPAQRERELFSRHDIPYLIGTQSLRSADAFDLVLISNAYTLELINLPYLLLRSGIPLYASQRGPGWPILLLGGSNALAAQAAIRADGDSLVDGIFFGEGEGHVGRLVAALAHGTHEDARKRLRRAAQDAAADSLWVAGSLHATGKAVCAPDAQHLAIEVPLLNSAEVHTANLQINYGCPAFCSFCFEGYDRKPYREIPLPQLLAAARQLKRAQGIEQVNLYSFNFNTHREILPLLLELHRLFYRVSVKSQRVDILQHTSALLEAEVEADKRSFTLGIEGISARQRAWLHKSLPTEDVTGLLERLFEQKIREIKLFYILTGHESEEDVGEFRAFVRQVKAIRRARNPGIRVIFSFGLLIRMPFTPLRYDRLFLDERPWRHLVGQAKSTCETNGFEFRLAYDWPTYCLTQVLALGGYWLIEPLVELARQGYCFDTTLPDGYWDQFRDWMREAGHWNDAFLSEKGPDYDFALDFVAQDISPDFLYRQYQEARAGRDGGYCLGSQDQHGRCLDCGACVDNEGRKAIVRHQIAEPEAGADAGPYLDDLREIVTRKRRMRPAYYVLRMDGLASGVRPEYLNALAFKAILGRYPQLAENLLAVRESLLTIAPPSKGKRGSGRGRFPTMGGESVFALYAWDVETLQEVLLGPGGTLATGIEALAGAGHSTRLKPPLPELTVEIVGLAEDFVPGTFTRLHLDLHLPAAHFERPRQELEKYLNESYVPYSLRREDAVAADARRYRFEVSRKGLKKKVLFGGYFETDDIADPQHLVAGLDIGPKFDLFAFLEQFGAAHRLPYADLSVSQIQW